MEGRTGGGGGGEEEDTRVSGIHERRGQGVAGGGPTRRGTSTARHHGPRAADAAAAGARTGQGRWQPRDGRAGRQPPGEVAPPGEAAPPWRLRSAGETVVRLARRP